MKMLVIMLGILMMPALAEAESYVELKQSEFVTMLGKVDRLKKEHANLQEQVSLYQTLREDHEEIIRLDKEHVAALEEQAEAKDALLTVQEQELAREKRLSRYKTYGAIVLGIAGWILY